MKWMQMLWKRQSSTFLVTLVVISVQSKLNRCHRITKKNSTVIVNLWRGKIVSKFGASRRNFKKKKIEDFNLPRQNKLFISRTLCNSRYCNPRAKSFTVSVRFSVFTFLVTKWRAKSVKTVVHNTRWWLEMTHMKTHMKYFPDIDLSPWERFV